MEEITPEEYERVNRVWYDSWQTGFAWLNEAAALKTAADSILNDYLTANKRCETLLSKNLIEYLGALDDLNLRLHSVYLLLAGYSIENLFKGIIICRLYLNNPSSIDKENFGETGLAHHGLIKFVDTTTFLGEEVDLGLKFNNEEREVMETLNRAVTWAGRYPIPKEYFSSKKKYKKYNWQDKVEAAIPYESPYMIINRIYDAASVELNILSVEVQKEMRSSK